MLNLDRQVAVVTGAAQGNGEAIAIGLAEKGVRVALCDIQLDLVEKVARKITQNGYQAKAYKLDVTDAAACRIVADAVLAEFGPVSILVNNAGIIRRTLPDADEFEADWSAIMRVNVDGPMFVIRAFLDQLRKTRGNIINLASIMSVAAGPGISAYAASKGAILQMTRALANDLAKDGIRVNAIAPGVIDTPMTEVTRNNPDGANWKTGRTRWSGVVFGIGNVVLCHRHIVAGGWRLPFCLIEEII